MLLDHLPLLELDPDRARRLRRDATAEAAAFLRARVWALEETAAQMLGEEFGRANGELQAFLAELAGRYGVADAWTATDAGYRARTEALLAQIGAAAEELERRSADLGLNAAVRGYQAGYYGAAYALDQGLRGVAVAEVPVLPLDAIRAQVQMPYVGSTFLDRFADARADFERAIRRSLVQSQIQGESIYKAGRRLAAELGVGGETGYRARLDMIARTEILRASNLGAQQMYEENADLLEGWEYVATRDERTCPICGPLDGTQYAINDPAAPIPPRHPRCRCTSVPVLLDSALQQKIAGPRQTYTEWAATRGLTAGTDGGALRERGKRPPKAPVPEVPTAPRRGPRPAGTPVSAALKVASGAKLAPARQTIAAIDKVHGDGELPEVPVKTSQARQFYGVYQTRGANPDHIAISRTSPHPRTTTAHEIGHLLDHVAIGARGTFASERSDLLAGWRAAVAESQAAKSLANDFIGKSVTVKLEDGREVTATFSPRFIRYATTNSEYFARSYAQYVTVRSQDPEMLRELNEERNRQRVPLQWTDEDFAPIAAALDKLFEFLGWRQ